MLLAIFLESVLSLAMRLSLGSRGGRLAAARRVLLDEALARPVAVLSLTMLLGTGHLALSIVRHGNSPPLGISATRNPDISDDGIAMQVQRHCGGRRSGVRSRTTQSVSGRTSLSRP
jgi:hypothetical protein